MSNILKTVYFILFVTTSSSESNSELIHDMLTTQP